MLSQSIGGSPASTRSFLPLPSEALTARTARQHAFHLRAVARHRVILPGLSQHVSRDIVAADESIDASW
jgi:hypothetical protein